MTRQGLGPRPLARLIVDAEGADGTRSQRINTLRRQIQKWIDEKNPVGYLERGNAVRVAPFLHLDPEDLVWQPVTDAERKLAELERLEERRKALRRELGFDPPDAPGQPLLGGA